MSSYRCNQIISTLNSSFFSTYIFSFFNTKSPSICHSSPLNTVTPAFFIFSTTLTTSLFFSLAIFIFSISTSSPFITTSAKLQIHCSLINVLFSLFFSTPNFQSSLLLSLSAFPIFVSDTCFKFSILMICPDLEFKLGVL